MQKNDLITLSITEINNLGAGVGKHVDGRVVFVHGAVRGETCVIRILKVLKNAAFARVEEIVERSENRVESDCVNFPACGGCDFRHLSYSEELEAKRMRVQDALQRIGGAQIEVTEILGSEETTGYRNKSQFPISAEGQVGFYRARSHNVIPTTDCLLLPPQTCAIAKAVEEYMQEFSVSAYNEKTGKGLLRHIYVRTNCEGAALVCLIVNGSKIPVQSPTKSKLRIEYRTMLLKILQVFSAPNTVGLLFLWMNGQTRQIIISVQFIPKTVAVIVDVFFHIANLHVLFELDSTEWL